jgi:hypothetical protein
MTRTKWLRLGVRDPADILRWAGEQNTRQLDDFRYRMIHGREFVSFRMVPRYAIEIGTPDIIVVAHVHAGRLQRLAAATRAIGRRCLRRAVSVIEALNPRAALPRPVRTAELYDLPIARASSPSHR